MGKLTPIHTTDELIQAARRMSDAPILALDTEFIGEHTYYPQLALVQIGLGETAFLVDPVALPDLAPLKEVLNEPQRILLVHDGESDLQILTRHLGPVSAQIFDTQLAAAFIGLPENSGLSTLVRKYTGKRLAKGQQVTNWLKRPLSPRQIQYAAEDVIYLGAIYTALIERLTELDRLGVFREEMSQRAADWIAPLDIGNRFRKMINGSRGGPRQREALREILAWREEMAVKRDSPRRHVLSDEAVTTLSQELPQNLNDLSSLRLVSERAVKRHGEEIVNLCRTLAVQPEKEEKPDKNRDRDPRKGSQLVPLVKMALEVIAAENSIAPGLIARAEEVEEICRHATHGAPPPDLPSMTGWRGNLVGRRLWAFAQGGMTLRVAYRAGAPHVELEKWPAC